MNLPSSMTKALDSKQLNFLTKRGNTDVHDSPTPEELHMDDIRRASSSQDRPSPQRQRPREKEQRPTRRQRWSQSAATVLKRHVAFIGPGIVASVGYTDPGNWVTDLAAGSQFGYALLFVVLLSGLFGIFLQILAVRMGVVTGEDLARNTRLLCLPEGADGNVKDGLRHRRLRTCLLWLAYVVAEGALIATELAELIGSAIALNLLFPSLPVWGGVLVTSLDVFVILFVYRPNGNFRILEWVIGGLVLAVIACFIALLVRVSPNWADVFHGFVPSSTLVQSEALYAGIGILGAVVMPHSLFLGSHFATVHRLREVHPCEERDRNVKNSLAASTPNWTARVKKIAAMIDADLVDDGDSTKKYAVVQPKLTIPQMKIQIPHASWDIALSLVFFAITVNAAILIVAGAAFFYGRGTTNLSDLYDAYALLQQTLGKAYAVLFAIALLAAGQSASITVTLAGQLVSEGFIKWKTNAFVRRLVTRLITVAPSIAIAVAVGRDGLDETLIASQVALSFALPVVLVPLLLITSLKSKMEVKEEADPEAEAEAGGQNVPDSEAEAGNGVDASKEDIEAETRSPLPTVETPPPDLAHQQAFLPAIRISSHNFTSPVYVIVIGVLIYLTILLADCYTLVTTIRG